MFCRCKILRYHTLSHEQNQFTIQSTIRLWTKSLMLLVSMHFHRPISGLWQRDATASKPSSLSWSSRAVSRSWHCPKSCMYESTMYGTRTAQIDLVLCSQVKLSICSHAHLFQNSVRQCLCWFEKHGHQNKCKGGRDSEDKCSPNIN